MSDNKVRNGLNYEVVSISDFFRVSEVNRETLIDLYRKKYGPKGTKHQEALNFLSEGSAAVRRDGRTAFEYLYDMCTGWLKEDVALIGLNALMPSHIYVCLCGHDENREIKSKNINSGPDFEFKNTANGRKISVQFKVTRNLPNYLRIKASDMKSDSYDQILFFREDEKQLYYLDKKDIINCVVGYDDRYNRPRDCDFRDEWQKEVYYVPRELIKKGNLGLADFVKFMVYRLQA